jgi:outer membrane protein
MGENSIAMTRDNARPGWIFLRTTGLAVCVAASLTSALADTPQSPKQTQTFDFSKPLTLKDAIQIGLVNQPRLNIARSQADASRSQVQRANARYYPSVSPSVSYTNQVSAFQFQGQTNTSSVEQTISQIGLRQTLFDSGRREENLLLAKYNAKASDQNVLDSRQVIIANVSVSYYDLQRQKELLKVADSSVTRAKSTLDATKAFADAGTSAKKDIFQAQSDYENALVQQIIAQNNVRLAVTNLKNAMGIVTPIAIVTPDEALPEPPLEADKTPVTSYLDDAFKNRPDLKRDTSTIDASRHNVKLAQIDNGVQLQADFSGGYRVNPNPGENRTLAASVSYPLFDGGLTRAAVRGSKAQLDQAREQLELSRQTVQLDVEQAYLQREEARARILATQSALKAARTNYDAATAARQEGAGTILDVITAQALLVTAETNAVQAIFDFYTADARLKKAVGGNDTFLVGGQKP